MLKSEMDGKPAAERYRYPIKPPDLMARVVPQGKKALVAMDSGIYGDSYNYARNVMEFGGSGWVGFPGYPYLAGLSTRAEFRMFAQAAATQLTREWIVLNSTETAGKETREKCKELMQMVTDLG